MTDEELQQAIQEISESIKNLPESKEPLPREEARKKQVLLSRKEILERIKVAREKNQHGEELYNTMVYGLLSSWGEKHPYLMHLAKANLRWNMF